MLQAAEMSRVREEGLPVTWAENLFTKYMNPLLRTFSQNLKSVPTMSMRPHEEYVYFLTEPHRKMEMVPHCGEWLATLLALSEATEAGTLDYHTFSAIKASTAPTKYFQSYRVTKWRPCAPMRSASSGAVTSLAMY